MVADYQDTLLKKIILILLIEKIAQHFLTALFFLITIDGIGTPDIGSNFSFNNETMAFFNFIYGLLFVLSFVLYFKNNPYSFYLIIILSFLDIVLEFFFHNIGFITVSVIVCTVLIILVYKDDSLKTQIHYTKL